MKSTRAKSIKIILTILSIAVMAILISSCSVFGPKSTPVRAPKLNVDSLPRLQRILPDYTNEEGEEDFYFDEEANMAVKTGEKVYLIIDYINKDNLAIEKVVINDGSKDIEVNAKEFVNSSSSERTTIEITITEQSTKAVTYTIKRILYNVKSQILDIKLLDEQKMTMTVNVNPIFKLTLDYQNGENQKEEKQIAFGSSLSGIIPSINTSTTQAPIPKKVGGWVYSGFFTSPDKLGAQVQPSNYFFFWQDVTIYANYDRPFKFITEKTTQPIVYEEDGIQKEYTEVAVLTRKTSTGDLQETLEIYDTLIEKGKTYPIVEINSNKAEEERDRRGGAFDNTANLRTLKIGKYLREIGNNAFTRSRVIDVEFHSEGVLTKIGDQAFMGTSRLGTGVGGFTLPKTVSYLGDYCFAYSSWGKMKTTTSTLPDPILVISDHLTHIGDWCFRETLFKEIVFESGVKFKADAIKGENYQLTSGENPTYADSDYYLGWCLFKDCKDITRFTTKADEGLNNGLEIIPDAMFKIELYKNDKTIGLTRVTLAEGLKRIGKGAFHYQKLLTNITLPNSLEDISGDNAPKIVGNPTFGDTKEKSEYGAFEECEKLSQVTFQQGSELRIIGKDAFRNLRELREITFTSPILEQYGDGPFNGCTELMIVRFENLEDANNVPQPMNNGRNISNSNANFFYPSLQFKIFVADTVVNEFRTSIGKGASSGLANNLPIYSFSMIKELFNKKGELVAEIALEETESILNQAQGWRLGFYFGREKNVYIPDEYEGKPIVTIASNAFRKDIERVRLPQYTALIESEAFKMCTDLQQIIFGDIIGNSEQGIKYLKRIGEEAFWGTKIKYFIGGENLEHIGTEAFAGCKQLIWVDLSSTYLTGDGGKEIGTGTFWQCENLEYIRFPSTYKYMKDRTLAECRNLKHIIFENGFPHENMFASLEGLYFNKVPSDVNICVPNNAINAYKDLKNLPSGLISRVTAHYVTGREPHNLDYGISEISQWWTGEEW